MKARVSLALLVALIMFPQIVETIYSPALTSIAVGFSVSPAQAAQTLSVYFLSFAVGVVVWGIAADRIGRRRAMLFGLWLYAISCVVALVAPSFGWLLLARVLSAFGIAVGSVVTQTMLRDCYQGHQLAKAYSAVGVGVALSPVLGMLLGSVLVAAGGHQWMFTAAFVLALLVCTVSFGALPETQPSRASINVIQLARKMVIDKSLWRNGVFVATFNIAVFSYYQLAGFEFTKVGATILDFGLSGIAIGAGTMLGLLINKKLVSLSVKLSWRLSLATLILWLCTAVLNTTFGHIALIALALLLALAFAIAVPYVLSVALNDYASCRGSAAALFGLLYYLLIGLGLSIAAEVGNLGLVVTGCALLSTVTVVFSRGCD